MARGHSRGVRWLLAAAAGLLVQAPVPAQVPPSAQLCFAHSGRAFA